MRRSAIALGLWCSLASASPAFADVQLKLLNGRVTLTAKDATVRQILTVWAKVGQTRIVNVERIPGGPLTLQLIDVPETQALDLLLRSVNGYLAAPRPIQVPNASMFDRIIVMPTSSPPPSSAAASQPPPSAAPPRSPRSP